MGEATEALAPKGDAPLLVIDGDSFAHRAYHAVPKSVRRADGKGGGAIVGFANYLIRFWQAEQPRAVLAAWDTLSVPNWRQKMFAPYQGGRVFERDIVEQLDRLPELVAACGFANAKRAGACFGREFPLQVRSLSATQYAVSVDGARFISGCPVFTLTLERVSDTTLEGKFLDGRSATLVRQ